MNSFQKFRLGINQFFFISKVKLFTLEKNIQNNNLSAFFNNKFLIQKIEHCILKIRSRGYSVNLWI